MAWAWTYLGVSVLGTLLVLNAFRPLRHGVVVVQSFFAGWYTAEMPVWHIVWQMAATVVFAAGGAFRSWPGWLGLAVALASWVGLFAHYLSATRVRAVVAASEAETPLPAPEGLVLPRNGNDTMWRFPRLALPLPRPTRAVRTVRNIDYWGDGRRRHMLDVITAKDAPASGAPVLCTCTAGPG